MYEITIIILECVAAAAQINWVRMRSNCCYLLLTSYVYLLLTSVAPSQRYKRKGKGGKPDKYSTVGFQIGAFKICAFLGQCLQYLRVSARAYIFRSDAYIFGCLHGEK